MTDYEQVIGERKNYIRYEVLIFCAYNDNSDLLPHYIIGNKATMDFYKNTLNNMVSDLKNLYYEKTNNGKVVIFEYKGDISLVSFEDFTELTTRIMQSYQKDISLKIQSDEMVAKALKNIKLIKENTNV